VAASDGTAVDGISVSTVVGSGGSAGGVVIANATRSVGGVDDTAVVARSCCEVGGLVQAKSKSAKPTLAIRTLLNDSLGSMHDLLRCHSTLHRA
jgi:hypothetical protein